MTNPTTARYGWQTPKSTDPNDVPLDMAILANAIETTVGRQVDASEAAWKTYSTQWYGGGNLSIGNGTLVSRWRRVGKTIQASVLLVRGSTTNLGAGVYAFTLPVNAVSWQEVTGAGYLRGTGKEAPLAAVGVSSGAVGLMHPLGRLAPTVPGSWAVGDVIFFQVTYQAGS